MTRAAVVVFFVLASGCAVQYRYVTVPPHLLPPRAEVPRIPADQLKCLSDEAYTKLVERDQALRRELELYRAIHGKN